VLVERAAEQEMDTLALTDRNGTYGAVKFAKACLSGGVRPVLGVDLAYRDPRGVSGGSAAGPSPRTPVRGGAFRDLRLPRVTFLAAGGRAGWAARVIADSPPLVVQGTMRALWTALEVPRTQAIGLANLFTRIGSDAAAFRAGQERFASGQRVEWRSR